MAFDITGGSSDIGDPGDLGSEGEVTSVLSPIGYSFLRFLIT